MLFRQNLLFILVSLAATTCAAQMDTTQSSERVSSKYLDIVSSKAGKLEAKLDKQTAKALGQWQKQEARIQRKLAKTDSAKAQSLFANAGQQYKRLEEKWQSNSSLQEYIPSLDTLSTSLKFLQQNPQLLSNAKEAKEKLSAAVSKLKGMQVKFQQAEDVKQFIKERRELLKNQLGNLGTDSYRYAKELKKLSKQAYYYSERLNEYKSLLKDHKKADRKALELLSRSKLFNNFMRKNSMLASLFRLPGDQDNPVSAASLAGLQTRAQVNGLIQQQIASGGPNARQQVQQNIQSAQSQVQQLKNKLLNSPLGDGGEMPDGFKPNNQKTKNFLKRLELGTNIQSQKGNGFFPVTSDLGLSVGYKLNDKSIIGIGASYKLGWGQNIRHINITHQGAGIRSFVDWKIKGSFWVSGGYEMNYRSEFQNIDVLKDLNAWQQSGLIGLSKVVSLKAKFFKKTKLQLLWDFLSYEQVPRTQPMIFRIGYSFK
jgi:hypothetical protein